MKGFFDCRLKSTDQVTRSISPSAYVVFRDVAATNDCGLIGSAIASTTVASPPSNLLMGKQAEDGTTIDYAQIASHCPSFAPSYSADSYNLCFPSLVMPLQVFNMNPALKNCNGDPTRGWILSGIMDPPRALIPSAALAPSPTNISDPSLSAAPASVPLQPLAPVTSIPIDSLPSPASMAPLVPESAGPQPGRDLPSLRLHNESDPAKTSQASCVDPLPSPAREGMGRLLSLQPLNNDDWGKGEPLNPATGSSLGKHLS